MTFKLIPRRKIKTVIKGILSSSIAYVINSINGIWNPPVYENQKWGQFDSDDCWCLSSVNDLEIELNFLLTNNLISPEGLTFYITNGYIVNGTFQVSELFHEILCGNLNNGGTSAEAWQSFASRGFIPRSMLNYSQALAQNDANDAVFVEDYYNINRVTPAMKALALKALQYVTIQSQGVGTDVNSLRIALKQYPVNIGIPIPYDQYGNCLWNVVNIPLVTTGYPEHEVSLLSIDSIGNMTIFDQYQPTPKILPAGYLVCAATQGIVSAVQPIITTTTSNITYWSQFWRNVVAWTQNKPLPFPKVPIGKAFEHSTI